MNVELSERELFLIEEDLRSKMEHAHHLVENDESDIEDCPVEHFEMSRRGEIAERKILLKRLRRNKEICLCAAVKTASGTVYPGRRHGHCFASILAMENDEERNRQGQVQGFLTNRGRFVDRREGMKLQLAAGIPSASECGYDSEILFSEDLY